MKTPRTWHDRRCCLRTLHIAETFKTQKFKLIIDLSWGDLPNDRAFSRCIECNVGLVLVSIYFNTLWLVWKTRANFSANEKQDQSWRVFASNSDWFIVPFTSRGIQTTGVKRGKIRANNARLVLPVLHVIGWETGTSFANQYTEHITAQSKQTQNYFRHSTKNGSKLLPQKLRNETSRKRVHVLREWIEELYNNKLNRSIVYYFLKGKWESCWFFTICKKFRKFRLKCKWHAGETELKTR